MLVAGGRTAFEGPGLLRDAIEPIHPRAVARRVDVGDPGIGGEWGCLRGIQQTEAEWIRRAGDREFVLAGFEAHQLDIRAAETVGIAQSDPVVADTEPVAQGPEIGPVEEGIDPYEFPLGEQEAVEIGFGRRGGAPVDLLVERDQRAIERDGRNGATVLDDEPDGSAGAVFLDVPMQGEEVTARLHCPIRDRVQGCRTRLCEAWCVQDPARGEVESGAGDRTQVDLLAGGEVDADDSDGGRPRQLDFGFHADGDGRAGLHRNEPETEPIGSVGVFAQDDGGVAGGDFKGAGLRVETAIRGRAPRTFHAPRNGRVEQRIHQEELPGGLDPFVAAHLARRCDSTRDFRAHRVRRTDDVRSAQDEADGGRGVGIADAALYQDVVDTGGPDDEGAEVAEGLIDEEIAEGIGDQEARVAGQVGAAEVIEVDGLPGVQRDAPILAAARGIQGYLVGGVERCQDAGGGIEDAEPVGRCLHVLRRDDEAMVAGAQVGLPMPVAPEGAGSDGAGGVGQVPSDIGVFQMVEGEASGFGEVEAVGDGLPGTADGRRNEGVEGERFIALEDGQDGERMGVVRAGVADRALDQERVGAAAGGGEAGGVVEGLGPDLASAGFDEGPAWLGGGEARGREGPAKDLLAGIELDAVGERSIRRCEGIGHRLAEGDREGLVEVHETEPEGRGLALASAHHETVVPGAQGLDGSGLGIETSGSDQAGGSLQPPPGRAGEQAINKEASRRGQLESIGDRAIRRGHGTGDLGVEGQRQVEVLDVEDLEAADAFGGVGIVGSGDERGGREGNRVVSGNGRGPPAQVKEGAANGAAVDPEGFAVRCEDFPSWGRVREAGVAVGQHDDRLSVGEAESTVRRAGRRGVRHRHGFSQDDGRRIASIVQEETDRGGRGGGAPDDELVLARDCREMAGSRGDGFLVQDPCRPLELPAVAEVG